MILNENRRINEGSTEFHIHRDNWYEHGKSFAFYTQRNAGNVRMRNPIYIPKSKVVKGSTNSRGITTFSIQDQVLRDKLDPGFSLVEW